MTTKKILFVSWMGGLGHITRDLAITKELHMQIPDVELSWLASHPSTILLKDDGEKLLPEADLCANYNFHENFAKGFRANVISYVFKIMKDYKRNVDIFKQVTSKYHFDLVIGDESYEISWAMCDDYVRIKPTFVMIHDFIGLDSMTKNPLENLMVSLRNRKWARAFKRVSDIILTHFFVGEPEDVRNQKFGFMLPNRRDWAKAHCKFLGNIVRFDPADYTDKVNVRKKLGYSEEPLIVCALGGTAIGKVLLELCGQSYPIIKKDIPNFRMVLVCGPRLSPESINIPPGIEIRGYVPELYEHYAASDLTVVMGGGTSTQELTALRRPFIYFPLEQQFDQQINVAGRLERHHAGIKMRFYQTTPQSLAEKVIANIGKEVTYPPIKTDGAQRAVQYIRQLLE